MSDGEALRSDHFDSDTENNGSDEQNQPDDREERKALSLQNLKAQLRDHTHKIGNSSADDGILCTRFCLSSDSRQPGQRPLLPQEQLNEPVVMHDQSLEPYWNELSDSLAKNKNIEFVSLTNIQLTKNVMTMLASNLRGIKTTMILVNTYLCHEGIKSLATLLEHNPNVAALHLRHTVMRDVNDMAHQ